MANSCKDSSGILSVILCVAPEIISHKEMLVYILCGTYDLLALSIRPSFLPSSPQADNPDFDELLSSLYQKNSLQEYTRCGI